MSQPNALYHWSRIVAQQFPHLSKPQACVLAAFSFAVALARRCSLPTVAEQLWWRGKPDSQERRCQRFLSNRHVRWSAGCTALARWVIGALVRAPYVVLVVDETSLREHLKVMAVSLAYRGRALPLAWWAYPNEKHPLGQRALSNKLLDWLAPAIPHGLTVVVQADRGIGNSPRLLRAIERRGWCYLVRVSRGVRVRLEDGREVPLNSLARRGQRWRGAVGAFKKAEWLKCWAITVWEAGQAEPWLLLTNWQAARGSEHGWRMWEELAFRDFKSGGWQWQRSRVTDAAHAKRLWLVLALAYAWAMSLGTAVVRRKRWHRQLMRRQRRHYRLFVLGLRMLQRWLMIRKRKLPLAFEFISEVPQ